MPDRTVDLIRFGMRTGQLGPALDRLTSESVEQSRRQRNDFPFAAWYPPVLLAACGAVVVLIAIYVLPKFARIFRDFKMPVPTPVLLLEEYEDRIWIAAVVAAVVLLICLGFQLRKIFRIDPPVTLLRSWRDRIAWRTPVVHALVRNRNLGDLCLSLADAVRAGHPLPNLLDDSARLSLNGVLRQRVLAWGERLRAGISPAESARAAGMPQLLVGMIATAGDNDGLADALAFLGRFYRDRFSLKREALRAAVIPVFTITIGVFVMAVALSLFVPMQELILKLSW
jgi:type II secretory pathway component PulF